MAALNVGSMGCIMICVLFGFQRKAVELVPPLAIVAQELKEPNIYKSKGATIELLFWVLIKLGDLHIKSVSRVRVSFHDVYL